MVYVNVERYMKVVHNITTLQCLANGRDSSRRRRIMSRVCAFGPTLAALVDICYYTTLPVSEHSMMCFNSMHPHLQLARFWIRMNICFILPIAVLIYCNGMIVYSVRKHVKSNSFGNKMRLAQLLPFFTVILFVCCWMPWIVSTIYYRSHVDCEELKYVVLNVCIAVGNMHCITSPTLYIIMRSCRSARNAYCFQSTPTPAQVNE